MSESLEGISAAVHDSGTGIAEVMAAVSEQDTGQGLAEVMAALLEGHGDKPALGERATDPATGQLLPRFDTLTYRQLWERVRQVAAAWHHAGLRPGDRVCYLGFTSTDYVTLDLAAIHLGLVAVPLAAGAPQAQLDPILAETEPVVLAAGAGYLDTAVECLLAGTSVRSLVVFDQDRSGAAVEAARERLAAAGSAVVVETSGDLLRQGAELPATPLFTPGEGDDPLALIIYTSGSTGAPKGAMYTQRLVGTAWYGFTYGSADVPVVGVHYMPLSHLAGRYSVMTSLARGGTGYFTAAADLSALLEDFTLVRPTELTMVPRVCDMLFEHYRSEVDRRSGEPGDVEAAARAGVRDELLGGRVAKAMVASAPLPAEMKTFLESCLGVQIHLGYGSTEAGGVLLDSVVQRPPVRDYKLVDVPELGYFTTDSPHPRGELLLKSDTLIPGYYRRPELTAEIFDADGYYRTGDIMAETAPDRLVFVDRAKDVLKLSQGEFVAVSRLETVFSGSSLVEQIFLYGNGERAHLLAVVVPSSAAPVAGDEAGLKTALLESLQDIARDAGLNSYEIPRDLLIETEPFSPANGLLSDNLKPLRPRLKERYGPALERHYAELAEQHVERLSELRRGGADRPVLETVTRAAQAVLGCSDAELRPEAHFTELGGDSLAALSFAGLLEEIFGVEVPAAAVLNPVSDLAGLARRIAAGRTAATERPVAGAVHRGAQLRADELVLEEFLDADLIAAAPGLPGPEDQARTVVLTGANGYLGRFLCLEWLERLAPVGGTLVCLVRGADADQAARRLEEAFDSDPELHRRYRELASGALEVLPADIAEPRLGLDEDTWTRLAATADLVVHPAAQVNHVLSYAQLFGPNVVGTAEVIRLALTTRRKPVTFLSSIAAVPTADATEDADVRRAAPVRELDDGYASGYANTKWAGEVLLREAHDRCGLPVAVVRSDMLLAHRRYGGQLNLPDVFTRLLLSLVATGIAPRSFYRGGERAHYDGLPVDFTAAAVAELGAQAPAGYRTYHAVNAHDDGISLDNVVDWLVEIGYPIQRIEDYDDWFTRFTTALRALPERQRAHSLLPLRHAFEQPGEAVAGSAVPAERFGAAVRASGTDVPHLTAELIRKYVTDLRALDLL
ncbi:NAD-dependent epimerase/dehydratase family protein [Saccharopolyspora aridisoli]|uniref:Carboxylic acid reductase n=1 Tax=Saccharopolyspora aridisoli TaxID=2530385 RepID=A0A4R4V2D0_9PSEU|nr:carboxylic acid reductase [Saccharopolyspora aridisoli]TDC95423.1 NAD-dependent epimerase/dehydratase family protein [Saccharopolyspora aridisoli]